MEKVNLKAIEHYITGIYKLDFPNNKSYIGQSLDIKSRVQEHNQRARKINSNREIQLCEYAIRKYGQIQDFIILERDVPVHLLDKREKYWISFYDTTNKTKGYNLLDKGDVSGRRGFDNPNCNITPDQVREIIAYIQNHPEFSLKKIGEKFDVSVNQMIKINNTGYGLPEFIYPIRDSKDKTFLKRSLYSLHLTEDAVLEIKQDLATSWWLSMEEDIPKKYNLSLATIRLINQGRIFFEYGVYQYPIRYKNMNNKWNVSKKDIEEILYLLKNTNMSMTEIGKKFGKGRAFVSKVNRGKSCPIPNYIYPARQI